MCRGLVNVVMTVPRTIPWLPEVLGGPWSWYFSEPRSTSSMRSDSQTAPAGMPTEKIRLSVRRIERSAPLIKSK
jgi:hypothetical protein